jgi:hypothetical protein
MVNMKAPPAINIMMLMFKQAQCLFRDSKMFLDMADPLLKNQFHEKDLEQAVAIAAMYLQ